METKKPSRNRDDEDRRLIEDTLHHGPEHFVPLVERYQSLVANVIMRMVGKRDVAADLTQEVFLRAYKNLDRFDVRLAFAPWIARIAHNLTLNHLNKRRLGSLSLDAPAGDGRGDLRDLLEDAVAGPEDRIMERERKDQIADAMERLPERYRMLILYRYWLDLTPTEISEVTGTPVGRVKYLLNYGRLLMHRILLHLEKERA